VTDVAVEIASVSSLANGRFLELIGEVEAVSQTTITTEASGRVVRVNVGLGDTIEAGAILAELENASERAAVLQAQGVYESAQAAAAQSDVSVDEAENALTSAQDSALTAYRNAFNSVRSIVLNDIDRIFTDPNGQIPGVRVRGAGYTNYLNTERVRFRMVLNDWQTDVQSASRTSDLVALLSQASLDTTAVIEMLDVLLILVNQSNADGALSKAELTTLSTTYGNDRATLNEALNALDSAQTTLSTAREGIRKAQIGGTNSDVSAANAQVKQALGSLRAAQANLEKTILRTSISGTVNSLLVKTGDFLSVSEVVARVANNEALEVTTYVSENERDSIAIGDTVTLAGQYEGIITNIAPAVDPDTRKIEVKISASTDALKNGDTVNVTLSPRDAQAETVGPTIIPITSLKVGTDRTVVFTVNDAHELVAHEVIVGPLQGSNIIIDSGVTADMHIVLDARGFNEGDRVSIRD